jgi:cobalt-zinc-cadmium efflux system membrane fusion protein
MIDRIMDFSVRNKLVVGLPVLLMVVAGIYSAIHILPNMFLQASIETRLEKTLAVPDDALVNYNGKRYVFISNPHGKNAEFSMLPVEVGVQESGWNAIKLSKPELENRDFVLKGAFAILSAMKNTGEGD